MSGCQSKNCSQWTRPVESYGGGILGHICAVGHITAIEKRVRQPRCEICGCRTGHATGCDYLCDDALEQATLWAEEEEWEESAAWIEYALAHNWSPPKY